MEVHEKTKAERMIENYAARVNVGQCGGGERFGDRKAQAEHYAAAMAHNKRIKGETEVVLDALGVPPMLHFGYHTYAQKLGKIVRNAWGEHAKLEEGRILVLVWQTRGLKPEIMLSIARDVFKLDLTVAEPPACAPAKEA